MKVADQRGVELTSDNNTTAWQKYLATGPLALLPLWDGYSSIVWSTSVAEAKRLRGLSRDELASQINSALQENQQLSHKYSVLGDEEHDGTKLLPSWLRKLAASNNDNSSSGHYQHLLAAGVVGFGKEVKALADSLMAASLINSPFRYPPKVVSVESSAVSFPLSFQQAKHYAAPAGRVVLIGDAAHTIHPQAGQGLNLGLLDVDSLTDVIVEGLNVGEDIGSYATLKRYEEDRYWKNLGMMTGVDVLNTLFKNSGDGPLRSRIEFVRSFGMLGINGLSFAKEVIAKFAVGSPKN